jgi:CRP-like cAMP-binding protein
LFINPTTRRIHVSDLETGEMFGELSVINNKLRTFTTKVKSNECTLMEINKRDFIHYINVKKDTKD